MSHEKVHIKICGVQDALMAQQLVALGVDYIGMIFHKPSKRTVDMNQAQRIVAAVSDSKTIPVAVFVEQSATEMIEVCNLLNVHTVQLHGDISRAQQLALPQYIARFYVASIDKEGNPNSVFKQDMTALNHKRDFIVFDGPQGGAGQRIVIDKLRDMAGAFRFFIAGGLKSTNVQEVIHDCNPYGVDVASGVEDHLGNKDIQIIQDFLHKAKMRRN